LCWRGFGKVYMNSLNIMCCYNILIIKNILIIRICLSLSKKNTLLKKCERFINFSLYFSPLKSFLSFPPNSQTKLFALILINFVIGLFFHGLIMFLVPLNISNVDFSPPKIFYRFLVPQKFSIYGIGPCC